MKRSIVFVLVLGLALLAHSQQTKPSEGIKDNFIPVYAFVNAHIADAKTQWSNATLVIQGERILAVGNEIEIPNEAIIIDVEGGFIYPSFIDLYAEYGMLNTKEQTQTQAEAKNDTYYWNPAIHPEKNAADEFLENEKQKNDLLQYGFGAVLSHIPDGIVRGTGVFTLLSKQKNHQKVLIKNASAHYSFQKGSSTERYPSSLMGSIALIRQTYLDAEWYKQGVKEVNYALDAFLQQQDLPQIFEAKKAGDISRIFKIADEFEVEYILKGCGKEYEELAIIKDFNFPFILPLNFPESYEVSNPEEAENLTLAKLKHWELAPYNPAILAKNNIPFSITTNGIKNEKEFLENLRLAIQKGWDKQAALASLTLVPAQLINASEEVGTIEKGKFANFIICSSDLFEDGIIYENWVAGEQNIIHQKQKIDFRGLYSLQSDEFSSIKVKILGKKELPKVEIPALDTTALLAIISDNEINFFTKDGKFRAIGTYTSGKISGRYQDQNSKFHAFIMHQDSSFQQGKEHFALQIDSTIPSIWHPNMAYGLDQIPLQETVIFKNATIWTNEKEGIIEHADIALKNGKIIAVGKELKTEKIFDKEDIVTTIDATGKHITCGIIDEHSHIAIGEGVNEGTQAVSAEVRIGDVINPSDINIYRQLAGGVTAAQLLHGSANPIGGQSALIKLRWGSQAEDMKIEGADGFIKFALGENVKQSNWDTYLKGRYPQTRMGVEQVFYDAFYRAKQYQLEWDLYNAMPSSMKKTEIAPREDLELIALSEILNHKRFVTCHSYVQSEINMLIHVADSMQFRINTFTHVLEGYKVAKKIKKHGAGGSTFSDWWAYKFEVNDAIPYNASLMQNAGIVTALNSDDAEMGRRLNQEAAKAIKYGAVSEEEAWKMVTLNPAKLLHLDNRMGSLLKGKDADIVLWSDNPLSVYAKVEKTYVDGICLYDNVQDIQLRNRDREEKMRLIQKMMNNPSENKKKPKQEIEKIYHCETLQP